MSSFILDLEEKREDDERAIKKKGRERFLKRRDSKTSSFFESWIWEAPRFESE